MCPNIGLILQAELIANEVKQVARKVQELGFT